MQLAGVDPLRRSGCGSLETLDALFSDRHLENATSIERDSNSSFLSEVFDVRGIAIARGDGEIVGGASSLFDRRREHARGSGRGFAGLGSADHGAAYAALTKRRRGGETDQAGADDDDFFRQRATSCVFLS